MKWYEMLVLQETIDFPIRVMVSSFNPQGSQECVKTPPTHWFSLTHLLPSEQPGPRRDNTQSTRTGYPPHAQIALQMLSMKLT